MPPRAAAAPRPRGTPRLGCSGWRYHGPDVSDAREGVIGREPPLADGDELHAAVPGQAGMQSMTGFTSATRFVGTW